MAYIGNNDQGSSDKLVKQLFHASKSHRLPCGKVILQTLCYYGHIGIKGKDLFS